MDGNTFALARRIVVLAGGESAEREISAASGDQVALALTQSGYEPVIIDPAVVDLQRVDWPEFHACFLALHGGAGEDGRIQAQLEQHGVPYTGSGPTASRLAMSKSAAKERFIRCGVPTLPYVVVLTNECRSINCPDDLLRRLAPLGYPMVIKPESQGSSLGVSVAAAPRDLPDCLQAAGQFDRCMLAEPHVAGCEFTVSILGRDPLPIIEIVATQPVFTYDAKYESSASQFRFDTGLPPSMEARLYEAAVAAAEALGTTGLVRVDLMLDTKDQPWVLEVNTIPGMTARSLAPRAAQAAGIEMPTLVDWMVRDALHRCRARRWQTGHGVLA